MREFRLVVFLYIFNCIFALESLGSISENVLALANVAIGAHDLAATRNSQQMTEESREINQPYIDAADTSGVSDLIYHIHLLVSLIESKTNAETAAKELLYKKNEDIRFYKHKYSCEGKVWWEVSLGSLRCSPDYSRYVRNETDHGCIKAMGATIDDYLSGYDHTDTKQMELDLLNCLRRLRDTITGSMKVMEFYNSLIGEDFSRCFMESISGETDLVDSSRTLFSQSQLAHIQLLLLNAKIRKREKVTMFNLLHAHGVCGGDRTVKLGEAIHRYMDSGERVDVKLNIVSDKLESMLSTTDRMLENSNKMLRLLIQRTTNSKL